MIVAEYRIPEDECQLEFMEIINRGSISTRYQPIVNLKTGETIGYEALSRGPKDSPYYSPLMLIQMAHEYGRVWDLEMLFRQKALEKIKLLKSDQFMFVNVDPDVIKSQDYKMGLTREYLDEIGAKESSIVFEITERTAITDYDMFQKVLENYRRQGYQIAIDDVGAGYSGLKSITEIRPNFIKIDMDLIRNIDKDFFKQALIKAFVETSTTTNITLIAEGIETKEELKTLILLGVHCGQGYYLQQPQIDFMEIPENIKQKIHDYNHISLNLNQYSQAYHYISNLILNKESTFESITSCEFIRNYMDKGSKRSICICDHEQPVGIVMRHNIDSMMSGKYGYAVFSNRPIGRIMNSKPLVVDHFTPINVVAKLAMGRSDEEIFDDVVVTKGNKFQGLVSMKDIFEYTLMYEKNSAKEQNPLTGLPGNTSINRVLSDIVACSDETCIIYVDINDFKIYNDVYGFEKGDLMIKQLAELIKYEVTKIFHQTAFVGHIGGDDFLIVCRSDEMQNIALAKKIIASFTDKQSQFFKSEHIENGKIVSEDRFGITRIFPLTTLSISGIFGNISHYRTTENLSEALAKLKKQVKKNGGNAAHFLPVSTITPPYGS